MSTAIPNFSDLTSISAPSDLTAFELLQQQHYDEIADDYEAHYSDEFSLRYRRQFIYDPMFEGIQLSGLKVLDAMCGSGQTTEYLLERDASVTGLDISPSAVNSFSGRWPNCKTVNRSLLDSTLEAESFDCISVVGGLHHVQPNVDEAVQEIYRLLKPGGYFCFMEPHVGSFPNLIRQIWYKLDHLFSPNEEAINLEQLQEKFSSHFQFVGVKYLGNIAFLLVLNSLIFRIPLRVKKYYSPLMLRLEEWICRAQTKRTSCFVVAQWRKRE